MLYFTHFVCSRASFVSVVQPSLTTLRNVLSLRVTIRAIKINSKIKSNSFRLLCQVLLRLVPFPCAYCFSLLCLLILFALAFDPRSSRTFSTRVKCTLRALVSRTMLCHGKPRRKRR